jgi:tRNA A-37 threonylcarbamoyl transferase component Bud32
MAERMRIQLVPRPGRPDFLDLPWDRPLEQWEADRLAVVAHGIGRHVVRFVEYGASFYALKELPRALAQREYRLLRALERDGMPAVEAVGVVWRPEPLADVLITKHLEFSLPYRLILSRRLVPDLRGRLLDALADLLVKIHLAGFFWGDCSLSNTLFRRDAGALAAYLVDVETGELRDELSAGQRLHDLDIAEENLVGELYDVWAELGEDHVGEPEEVAADVRREYERLWADLTSQEEFAVGERTRLEERLRRLNERGFDVEEVEIESSDSGYLLSVRPQLIDHGHHRRRLLRITGLSAQENQARRLLQDIDSYRLALERDGRSPVSEAALSGRWLTEIFEPTIAAVPPELRGKRDAAQLYHEVLAHRDELSLQADHEVPVGDAVASYVQTVLQGLADERTVLVRRDWGQGSPE